MRRLSAALGRDEGYVGQLLDPKHAKGRALPTPDELRAAAPLLGVRFAKLLEVVWSISPQDVQPDLQTSAPLREAWVEALDGLAPSQREQALAFARFLRAQETPSEE
jgi:hypothetical protein